MFLSRTHLISLCPSKGPSFLAPCSGAINTILPLETRDISGLIFQHYPSLHQRHDTDSPSYGILPSQRLSSSLLSSSLLSGGPVLYHQSRRRFSLNVASMKGVNPPVMDMRNTDIDINPDEIEFVGRKLRKFQMDTTGVCDPLPSEVEPSPLHLVTLTRPYSGNAWWLKKILWEFGMYRNRTQTKKFPEYQKAIVPNTPENNQKLAKIKHCVRIDRVTFPYGHPESQEDLKHMRISEHGEVTFVKHIESHVLDDGSVATVPLGVPRESLPEEMDDETIRIDCFRKLRNQEFLSEYHPEYDNRELGQGHFPGMKIYWERNKPPIGY